MSSHNSKTGPDQKADRMPQIERFREAARELECDDDPKAFEKRVAKIAKAKLKGATSK